MAIWRWWQVRRRCTRTIFNKHRKLTIEGLEDRKLLTAGALPSPIAVDDVVSTESDAPAVIDVLANDNGSGIPFNPNSLAISKGPVHGTATIRRDQVFGDDGSPVGNGSGSAISSTVETDGSILLQVSGYPDLDFTGAHTETGSYRLFVKLGTTTINPLDFDFHFTDALAPAVTDTFTISRQIPNTPFVAWIDNTTGSVAPDTILRQLQLPVVDYTPNPGFKGTDSFKYLVKGTNGATSNRATVTVNVLNRIPIVGEDSSSTPQDTAVAIDVLANDFDPDGTIAPATLVVSALPPNGTVVVQQSDAGPVLLYTPSSGFVGTDFFVYKVRDNDGGWSGDASVYVDVFGPNQALGDDKVVTQENKPISVAVLANIDPNSMIDPASLTISSAPQRGTAAIKQSATGPVIVYTPARAAASQLVVSDPRDLDDGDYSTGRLSLREAVRLANADQYTETFRYMARDIAGKPTNEATVTVEVAANPTTITFAASLTSSGPRTLTLSQVGDTFEGNTAWAITTAITIIGPAQSFRQITLAGQGSNSDLRAFLVKNSASLTLQNLALSRWASDSNGGAVYVEKLGKLSLSNCNFSNNFAVLDGGAIYSEGTLTVTANGTFSSNRARNGGAIQNYGTATLTGITLTNNRAVDGGAINNGGDKYSLGDITLTNCQLSANKADKRGGGLFLNGIAKLTNCVLVRNSAHDGGGIANLGFATLVNVTVIGNTAINGGGVYNEPGPITQYPQAGAGGDGGGGYITFGGCTISGNTAERGGGIFNFAFATLVNCVLIDNRAKQGGGIYHDASVALFLNNPPNKRLDLSATVLTQNIATYAGGGLFTNGSAIASNSKFTKNTAFQGSAVYNELDSVAFNGSTVAENISRQGPQLFNHLGVMSLANSTITDKLQLRFIENNGPSETEFVATSPGKPTWGTPPPAATTIVTAPDGVKYALTANRELLRQLPGSGWTVLGDHVLEYKIAPSGHCFWLNDHRDLYHAQPGYAGSLRSQDVQSFAMDSSGTLYWNSNVPTPGNSAAYRSLTVPLLDPVEEPIIDPSNFSRNPPTDAEVYQATGLTGLSIRNARFVAEQIVDYVLPPRYFPNVGLAQMHVGHYKVTVYYSTEFRDEAIHIIYLSRNHLHRYVPGQVSSSVRSSQSSSPIVSKASVGNVAATSAATSHIGGSGKIVSFTTGPDGTLYKLGGDFNGIHGGGQQPLPLPLWRLVSGGNWEALFPVYHFDVSPDNSLYVLTADHELKRLSPSSAKWTTVELDVESFTLAPDGTLYVLNAKQVLRRLLPGASSWSTLDTGVKSFSMTADGTIYELNGRQQLKRLIGRSNWTILDTSVKAFYLVDDAIVELTSNGQLKRRPTNSNNWTILDSGVQSFTMASDGTIYELNSRHELKRLTARAHLTVVDVGIKSFGVSRNGDLYLLNSRGELRRLKPDDHWFTLQTDVESFSIDAAGRVYSFDGDRQLKIYSSLDGNYVLGPLTDRGPQFALDPPSDLFVLQAANIVPPSDQYFAPGPEFPFNSEVSGLRVSSSQLHADAASTSAPTPTPPSVFNFTSPVLNARNVRITKEKLVDSIDSPRLFSVGGPAQLHHAYYRCTVYFTTDSDTTQQRIVFIDFDHLHMVGDFELEDVRPPDAHVFNGQNEVLNGTGVVSFGFAPMGSSAILKTLILKNTGDAPLTLTPARLTGSGFSIVTNLPATLAPGRSVKLVVRLDTAVAGNKIATLSFYNNDPKHNPFHFQLSGRVTVPEVDVFNGSVRVATGTGVVAFGPAILGGTEVTKTLTITNTGLAPLTMASAKITGAGFTIIKNLPATLAPGASAKLVIRLDTKVVGIKRAILSFSNNDPNESSYSFKLTGNIGMRYPTKLKTKNL